MTEVRPGLNGTSGGITKKRIDGMMEVMGNAWVKDLR